MRNNAKPNQKTRGRAVQLPLAEKNLLQPLASAVQAVLRRRFVATLGASVVAAGAAGPAPRADAEFFPAVIELSSLDGNNGFVLNGIDEGDYAGSSAGAGDVNGDGFNDVIIGASRADPNGNIDAGESYVVFGTGCGFPAAFDLATLDGTNGFVLNGVAAEDNSGLSTNGAGDVNGDGFGDLIIGAPSANQNGNFHGGESYVVFGRAAGFPAALDLTSLDGTNGFVLRRVVTNDHSGRLVRGVGDVNGDGIDDVSISAPNGNGNLQYATGQSYVIFGSEAGYPAVINLSSIDGANGFVISGIAQRDRMVGSRGAGDINGDGVGDLILGAGLANRNGFYRRGQSYVVFGNNAGFPAQFNLSSLDGRNGFLMNGIGNRDSLGQGSGVGDVNGDGIDDFSLGAHLASPNGHYSGQGYVVYGSETEFPAELELSSLDGTIGFAFNGTGPQIYTNFAVSAGDVNGDGVDDLITSASALNPYYGNYGAGLTYVLFGRDDGFRPTFELSSLDGSNGFRLDGISAGDLSGGGKGVGDVNGDGIDDLIIGATRASPNGVLRAGQTYVVFGRRDTDRDGLADGQDNCTQVFNPTQTDADFDGFGNECDPDINNDGIVNVVDLGLMRPVFFSHDAIADFNIDGDVNLLDLAIMKSFFFGPPGPSGVVNGCEVHDSANDDA